MNDIFSLKDDIVYCSKQDFVTRRVNTVYNGIDILSYLGPKIWLLIPNEIKSLPSLELFKKKSRYGNLRNVHVVYVRRM